jgi:hypothetical protein
MEMWRYGLTLLPLEATSESGSVDATIEQLVRSRRDLGWELVRKTEHDDSEVLVFRKPA